MRIGIDCRLWDETGVGRYIRNLVEELAVIDQQNIYVLFCLKKDIEKLQILHLTFQNFTVVTADIRWHSVEEQILFPQIIYQEQVDLMHFPYFSVPLFYNQPFVVTIHDLIIHQFPTGKASTLPYVLYKVKRGGYAVVVNHAIKKSRKVIVPLHAVADDIVRKFHVEKEKIVITYEGADLKLQKKNEIAKITEKFFLHVGNVYPHKNCERLIDAFGLVVKEYPHEKLIFVGKLDYFMQRLKKYVDEKNFKERILFVGEVSDEELTAYYQHANGLVITSLMEGFGLPALEAMSRSCLVLASAIPSLQEVCGDAALFCAPQDSHDIAKCMIKALQLPASEKEILVKKGLKRCDQFSWKQMAKETLAVYESCAGV